MKKKKIVRKIRECLDNSIVTTWRRKSAMEP
ncbi:MAG: hypothetical protein ACI82A_001485 [Candidatus Azotimanducaceae bacterium]